MDDIFDRHLWICWNYCKYGYEDGSDNEKRSWSSEQLTWALQIDLCFQRVHPQPDHGGAGHGLLHDCHWQDHQPTHSQRPDRQSCQVSDIGQRINCIWFHSCLGTPLRWYKMSLGWRVWCWKSWTLVKVQNKRGRRGGHPTKMKFWSLSFHVSGSWRSS